MNLGLQPAVAGQDESTTQSAAKRARSRRGEGDRLREEILDVAEQLLFEHADPEAVSIRAIGQRVGVSAPSIYRHFPDKETLITAVCRRGFDRMAEIVRNRLDGVTDPIERLHAMARGYCEFALGNPAQYRALLMSPQIAHHEASQAPSNFPDLLNSVDAAQRTEMAGFHALVGIVTEGIAAGALRADNPIDMALFLWTGVHGIVSLRLADPRMPWPPIDQQLDQYFMLIGLGILGPQHTGPQPRRIAQP